MLCSISIYLNFFFAVSGSVIGNDRADSSIDAAHYKCLEFYNERREGDYGVTVSQIGEGGQGVVYKCTTLYDNSALPVVAIKFYREPIEYNFAELERKDISLSERELAPELYGYFYEQATTIRMAGKIEEYLAEFKNVDDANMSREDVYTTTAQDMARIHLTKFTDMPLTWKYNVTTWPWNTALVYEHLTTFVDGGNPALVAEALGIPLETMDNEYKWTEKLVHSTSSPIVFCHNDMHGGNIMVNWNVDEDDNYDAEEVQIIDFDNAEYGYRAFDFEYHFSHWRNPGPTVEQENDFIELYLSVWNAESPVKYTLEDIRSELDQHRPYVLMEQMLFFSVLVEFIPFKHIERYHAISSKLGHVPSME